jgi:Mg-chelatase subunit ChlD
MALKRRIKEYAMKVRLFFAVFALYLFAGLFSVSAQTAADRNAAKRDIYVMLDVSGSMNTESKFDNVISYIETEVLDGLLKIGDNLTLISFGNTASEVFSRLVSAEADREELRRNFRGLEADDDYTDIGTALETLAGILEQRNVSGVRRLILFITDGKNTPPPESPYFGRDLSLDERFRSAGEKIARSGWFLYVIGIGGEADVKTIAGAVDGSVYTTTGSDLDGLEVDSYIEKVDEQTQSWEDAQNARREEAASRISGIDALDRLLGNLASLTGLSAPAAALALLALLLLVLLLLFLLFRSFRGVEIIASDSRETIKKKISPFAVLTLNSPGMALPALGPEDRGVIRIERRLGAVKIRVLDETAFAGESPLRKAGSIKLTKPVTVQLVNKKSVTLKKR